MKKYSILFFAIYCLSIIVTGCDDPLKEDTYSVLGPSNFYNTAEDAEALLNSVYANSTAYRDLVRDEIMFGELTTDILLERQGAINSFMQPFEDFGFTSSNPRLNFVWSRYYSAIYRANTVIDRVPDIDMDPDRRSVIVAEARFLRAFNYAELYNLFGPTPLITSSDTSPTDRPERAANDEFVNFIEQEFQSAANNLPAAPDQFGRATSGAALGMLSKFYLNQKNWEMAAQTAQQVIDSGIYSLFTDGDRTNLFALANQRNSEIIFAAVFPDNPMGDLGNTYLSHAAPPGYKFQFPPKVNFAAQLKIRSDFLNLFDQDDQRLGAFVFQYENAAGDIVQLGQDDVRSFKYPEDPNGVGDVSGNNFPYLRYADILLTRAEALNELNGPNQESVNLINQVREAAGVEPITIAEYASQDQLRAFIFDERAREFHTEGLRREDLIREGEFIEMAGQRGKNAADFQTLFPLPQPQLDKNTNLEQNEGY